MTTDLHPAPVRTTEPGALSTGVLLGRVVAAEWVKARSLASTWSALGTLCFVLPAIGAVVCATLARADVTGPAFDPLVQVYAGLAMSQVALGVLGAVLVTGEYSSGSITATLTAVPDRRVLLAGKAVLVALLSAPFALAASTLTVVICLPLLRSRGADLTLTDPGVVRGVLGAAAVLVLTALLGLGVGALLRSSAAATIGLTSGLFLLPVLVLLLPAAIRTSVGPWTPGQAGAAVLVLTPRAEYLGPFAGLLLFTAWAALAMVLASVALVRRDA